MTTNERTPTIFIDFDGVLHPTSYLNFMEIDGELVLSGDERCCWAHHLQTVLDGFVCDLVIHSSWRDSHSVQALKEMLPIDLHQRVVGKTSGSGRHESICRYVEQNNIHRFLVLDDSVDEFPENCSELVPCESNRGISDPRVKHAIWNFILEESMASIRTAIYGDNATSASEGHALHRLQELSDRQIPEAMHQLGQLLWEGIVISTNDSQAYELISTAVNMGYSPAMASLGAMHMAGAGCNKAFPQALHWYRERERTDNTWNSVRIGRIGLNDYEFFSDYVIQINGINYHAADNVLERLNYWLLDNKVRTTDRQSAILKRNPSMFGGISERRLPYYGASGGSSLVLAGHSVIEQIVWKNSFLDNELRVSWEDFSPTNTPPRLTALERLESFSEIEIQQLRDVYQKFTTSNSTSDPWFELNLSSSSVHCELALIVNGQIIFQSQAE